MTAPAAISIQRASKRFALAGSSEGVLALSDLSLDIAPGAFVAVLGPSGCGKSTLLRTGVAALEQPTGGKVTVNGAAPGWWRRRMLGVAFEDHALLPHELSVEDNIALPFHLAGRRVDGMADRPADRAGRPRGLRDGAARGSSPAACASRVTDRAGAGAGAGCCCSTSRSARSTPSPAAR